MKFMSIDIDRFSVMFNDKEFKQVHTICQMFRIPLVECYRQILLRGVSSLIREILLRKK